MKDKTKPDHLIQDKYKQELDTALGIMKHYISIQFAQLSVFSALTGGALWQVINANHPLIVSGVICTLGFVASICFWISWESMAMIVSKMIRRAGYLEIQLGFDLLSTMPGMPEYKLSPSKIAQRVFYVLAIFGWFITLLFILYELTQNQTSPMQYPLLEYGDIVD